MPNVSSRRIWVRLFQLAVLALVLWGISRSGWRAWEDLQNTNVSWTNIRWQWLAVAGGLYALAQLPMGWYWHRILLAMDQQPALLETLRAFFIGHVGKYVPGKVLVVVIRAGLIRGGRVDAVLAAASVFVETFTYMAVASFLAALVLMIHYADQLRLQLLAGTAMLAMVTITAPPVLRGVIRVLQHRRGAAPPRQLERLGWGLIASGWGASSVSWILNTLSLWAVMRALPFADVGDLSVSLLMRLMASLCLAVVAGFVSPLPGGLGVREWVLDELMAPHFTAPVAFVSSVLLRVVWLLTELIGSTILVLVRPQSASSPPSHSSSA